MQKEILHIDCNKFYASVECCLHPELKNKPVVVGGSEKSRHGIVLTKNEIAAKYDLSAGESLWSARQKCPDLIVIEPHFEIYKEFSSRVRGILEDYTDLIEPFSIDEAWIDVTGDWKRSGIEIAQEIRQRIKDEIGITVSIGVSFNKVFAKLGSDYKKPDAVTVISKENYKDIVWSLPCNDLLMVGPATTRKLSSYGILTIGDIANSDTKFLRNILGKNGEMLKRFACGLDNAPVRHMEFERTIKSIGNSTTTPRDLICNKDAKIVFSVLADSVSRRMRKYGFKGTCLTISVRDKALNTFTRQCRLQAPTNISREFVEAATALLDINYDWKNPIRSLGLSVSNFEFDYCTQYDLSGNAQRREKLEKLESTIDKLKEKYGNFCIQNATELYDTELSRFNPFDDHTIHPISPV